MKTVDMNIFVVDTYIEDGVQNCSITCKHYPSEWNGTPTDISFVHQIVRIFDKYGFDVSSDAIIHNLEGFYDDCKCGYRDEENGCFLFTPYGECKLVAMPLIEGAEDWQETYEA